MGTVVKRNTGEINVLKANGIKSKYFIPDTLRLLPKIILKELSVLYDYRGLINYDVSF